VTPTIDDAKSMARRLRAAMKARGLTVTHADTLEIVAAQLGFRDWNTTSATLNANGSGEPRFNQSVPIMLSLDEGMCRKFYCDFLGFEIEFEHRLAPNMPVYLALRRGEAQLHLSPLREDVTEGSAVLIWMTSIEGYQRELAARSDGHSIPKVAPHSWGRELAIADPFGNRLRFCERPANGTAQGPIGIDGADTQEAREGELFSDTMSFDLVREIGAELPGVKATGDSLGTSLKMGGVILACSAIHKSAEPDSLMIRVSYERRNVLLAESPEAYYLTGHYDPYPVVLVRLSHIGCAQLRALLKEGWEFVRREGR